MLLVCLGNVLEQGRRGKSRTFLIHFYLVCALAIVTLSGVVSFPYQRGSRKIWKHAQAEKRHSNAQNEAFEKRWKRERVAKSERERVAKSDYRNWWDKEKRQDEKWTVLYLIFWKCLILTQSVFSNKRPRCRRAQEEMNYCAVKRGSNRAERLMCEKVSWLCSSVMWQSDDVWFMRPPSHRIKQAADSSLREDQRWHSNFAFRLCSRNVLFKSEPIALVFSETQRLEWRCSGGPPHPHAAEVWSPTCTPFCSNS